MSYLGSWKIDDALTFTAQTHRVDTGAAADADSDPTYRVYEDETGTAILTGTMAKLDDANTTGFYSEQITLSAANGLEKGKCYHVRVAATVNSIAAAKVDSFQIEAEVDANVVSDKTGYRLSATGVDDIWDEVMEGTRTARQFLRGFAAALLAKLSGAATTNVVVRDVDDTKNRIDATVDADGNRSAITLDLT